MSEPRPLHQRLLIGAAIFAGLYAASYGLDALAAGKGPLDWVRKHWDVVIGLIALVSGVWQQLKMLGTKLMGVFMVTMVIDKNVAAVLATYLVAQQERNHAKKGPWFANQLPVRPLRKFAHVAFHSLAGANRIYWDGHRPMYYHATRASNGDFADGYYMYLRGTVNWEDLLLRATTYVNAKSAGGEDVNSNMTGTNSRFSVTLHEGSSSTGGRAREAKQEESKTNNINWNRNSPFRLIGWNSDDIGNWAGSAYTLSHGPELKATSEEFRRFVKMKAWFEKRGITWKRGWLVTGDPGTGKSSFIRAEGRKADWPIHVLDLGSMTNRDLRAAAEKVALNAPCIAVIEDIDAVFEGRVNITVTDEDRKANRERLTFDALLQVMDGLDQINGVAWFVSTNHPDPWVDAKGRKHQGLDEALTRPGRLDRRVDFGPLKLEQRLEVARRIVAEGPHGPEQYLDIAEKIAVDTGDVTAAKFQEVCCRIAIQLEFGDVEIVRREVEAYGTDEPTCDELEEGANGIPLEGEEDYGQVVIPVRAVQP